MESPGRRGAASASLLCALVLATGTCSGPARAPGEAAFERAQGLERQADLDERRTREQLYDRARGLYRESCDDGWRAGCAEFRRLDALLVERRGECAAPDECAAQGAAWLPDWRGERRLSRLCWGRRVSVLHAEAPPRWEPYGPACVLLGDFYRDGGRDDDAARAYVAGCERAGDAISCRRDAERSIDDLDGDLGLRAATRRLVRGCELDDAASCARLAEVEEARHDRDLGTDPALRTAAEGGVATAGLGRARAAADRACELGAEQGCEHRAVLDGRIAEIEQRIAEGCVFLANCGVRELCNTKTGRCEGPTSKGEFFEAYERGIRLFDDRKLGAAREAFARASKMVPDAPGPWRWLGMIALRQKRYADCAAAFAEALRLNPRSRYARAMAETRDQCRAKGGR